MEAAIVLVIVIVGLAGLDAASLVWGADVPSGSVIPEAPLGTTKGSPR